MSGGLAGAGAPIAREGRMMLEALAADAAKSPVLIVTVLVEEGRVVDLPESVRRVTVARGTDVATLVDAARAADWTLVVAPETDGVLCGLVRAVRDVGGRVLAPTNRALALATDKQATVDALAAHGIPVPAGRALATGEPIPTGFHIPAVRKARTGCGGEGLEIIRTPDVPTAAGPTRLEALAQGMPVGVSCICGPRTAVALPPLHQVFTTGDALRYTGGDPLTAEGPAARAATLALRAVAAVGAEAGWVGVDLILGERADGRYDRVLEVNPRVTTSFVGLTRLYAASLVAAMIDAAAGVGEPSVPVPVQAPDSGSFRVPGG
jgi:predicted ATP-grasp superfamily ATP-dependent carboligase